MVDEMDAFSYSFCRQFITNRDESIVEYNQDDACILQDDRRELSLSSIPIHQYSREELKILSNAIGKSNALYLEIEGVVGLNWDDILECDLDEVCVTVKSTRALENIAEALCYNTTLSAFELNYEQEEKLNCGSYHSVHEQLFKGLMPLDRIILRGISPALHFPVFDEEEFERACSWRCLTIENCILTENIKAWLPYCIKSLQKLVLTNCQLSNSTMKILSEEYLSVSNFDDESSSQSSHRRGEMKEKKKKLRKNPLQVLDLSNNVWMPPCDENNNDESPSCMTILSSLLDSLSYLVQLDLSDNPEIFHNYRKNGNNSCGMFDICGTVNHSLRRFSIRRCELIPLDLQHMVNTFCWLEALDLSENPDLISDLSPLIQLENLTEIVLEDMFESRSNDAKNHPCDLNNNGIDNGHVNDNGLRTLLFDLASEENGTDSCHRLTQRRRPLERLNLSGNTINSGTLTALSMFTSLKVLILVGCQLKGDGLIELLGHSSSLKELYIASNIIGDSGILSLAQSIKEQRLPYLKVLHMKSNVFSVNAFREFVNDGLAHSKRLESVEVSNTGAITSSQQNHWNILEQMMQHYLLLNQAGRFTLFVDHYSAEEKGKDTSIKSVSTNNICDNKIPTNLWPIILEDADLVYGADALYYFLHKRPDLIISSQHSQGENNCQKLAYNNTLSQTTSPKSVTDIAAYPSLSNYTNT